MRRLVSVLLTMLVVSFAIYGLMELIPGDPATITLGVRATPELVAARRAAWGLDQPFLVRYGRWVSGAVLRGDLGVSFYLQEPVAGIIAERFPLTLILSTLGLVAAVVIGIPLGMLAAVYKGRLVDKVAIALATLGVSIPGFWMGLMGIFLFAVHLGWLPSGGYVPLSAGFGNWIRHLLLPVTAVGLINAGAIARMMRSSQLEVLGQMYITTARAKGVKEVWVMTKHALRNALLPVVTLIGLTYASLFGGAVVIETVFSIPGLSRALLIAVNKRDNVLLAGCILLSALIFLSLNLVVDILYAVLDPKIKYN